MRESKFRVWDKRYKQYVKPYAICLDGRAISITEPNNDLETLDSERVIIEFNTGLKDKNGKEIYEGDIIDFYGEKYEVVFRAGCFWAGYSNNQRDYLFFYSVESEVIGNIHEHQELLETQNVD